MHKLWWTWGFELNFDPSEDWVEKFSVFNISFLPWLHILCVGDYSFCKVLTSPCFHVPAIAAMPLNPSWSLNFPKRHWLNIILRIHSIRTSTISFPFHPFTTKHIPLTRRRDVSVLRKREKHISRRENGKEITITASSPRYHPLQKHYSFLYRHSSLSQPTTRHSLPHIDIPLYSSYTNSEHTLIYVCIHIIYIFSWNPKKSNVRPRTSRRWRYYSSFL